MNLELKMLIYKNFKSQRQFAKRLGIREAELSKIIHRKIKDIDIILKYRICSLLGTYRHVLFPES
jgi:hypothetical protein